MGRRLPTLMIRVDETIRTRARTGNFVSASDPEKEPGRDGAGYRLYCCHCYFAGESLPSTERRLHGARSDVSPRGP